MHVAGAALRNDLIRRSSLVMNSGTCSVSSSRPSQHVEGSNLGLVPGVKKKKKKGKSKSAIFSPLPRTSCTSQDETGARQKFDPHGVNVNPRLFANTWSAGKYPPPPGHQSASASVILLIYVPVITPSSEICAFIKHVIGRHSLR